MTQKIKVTVLPDGNYRLEAENFDNAGCLNKTAGIEALLGQVESREMKPEAQIAVTITEQQSEQQYYSM